MEWLDLIFPKKCVACGRWGRYVCANCEVGLWEEEQICPTCGRNSRYGLKHRYCKGPLAGLTCFWAYEGVARKLISLAKYKFYFDYLGELTGAGERDEFYYLRQFLEAGPTVVPVPLYPLRERERGFNQAGVIAKQVARGWGLESRQLLTRVRDTGRQVGRTREERQAGVAGAFAMRPDEQAPRGVLLADDVWTTGATMRECAKTLRRAGVKYVWGLVLAR